MTEETSSDRKGWRAEPVMLPYQQRWVADSSPVKVIEKSRRIGITWAEAGDDTLAAADGTDSTWYIGPTEGHALEFIRDCEFWARSTGMVRAVESMDANVWVNEHGEEIDPTATDEQSIQAFRIRFRPASGRSEGREIVALSSRPRNLRGKGRGGGGRVVLDEYAFHPEQDELIKAAGALLMRGGKIRIISTHDGINNGFNRLIAEQRERAEQGKPAYSVHRATLDDALAEGFFERFVDIERRRGEMQWPDRVDAVGMAEAREEYRQWLVDFYGMGADEELFCIPTQIGAGDYFQSDTFPVLESLQDLGRVEIVRTVRSWDFAATRPNKKNPDPDWTRGIRCHVLSDGRYLISGMASLRDGPAAVNSLLETVTAADGRDCEVLLLQEPGAAGKSDVDAKARALTGYQVHVLKPSGTGSSKEAYARVWAPIARRGDVLLLRGTWVAEFLRELEAFPKGRHDDCVDPVSAFFELVLAGVHWSGKDGMTAIPDRRRPPPMTDARGSFWDSSDMPDEDDDYGVEKLGGGYF